MKILLLALGRSRTLAEDKAREKEAQRMEAKTGYSHRQTGIFAPSLLLLAIGLAAGAANLELSQYVPLILGIASAAFVILTCSFWNLTVADGGDRLVIRFGPLHLFRKTIPYASMTNVQRDRSRIRNGWGIHWTSKGWLWNIHGFDCIRVETKEGATLIGTDDPEGLIEFVRTKIAKSAA